MGREASFLFSQHDLDANRSLDRAEFQRLLLTCVPNLSVADMECVFLEFDQDNNGYVDVTEFNAQLSRGTKSLPEELMSRVAMHMTIARMTPQQLFSQNDQNQDGRLSRAELDRALARINVSLYQADVDTLFAQFDRDRDGYVDYSEFVLALEHAQGRSAQRLARQLAESGYNSAAFLAECRTLPSASGNSLELSSSDFERVMLRLLPTLPAMEVRALLMELDTRCVGRVNCSSFGQRIDQERGVIPAAVPTLPSAPVLHSAQLLQRVGLRPNELFNFIDADRDGTITRSELQRVLSQYVPELPAAHYEAIFVQFDKDRNGRIDLAEFVTELEGGMRHLPQDAINRLSQQVALTGISPVQIFQQLDLNGDNWLSKSEFETGVIRLMPNIYHSDIDVLFRDLDKDANGFVDVNEFCSRLQTAGASATGTVLQRVVQHVAMCGVGMREFMERTGFTRVTSLSRLEFELAITNMLPSLSALDCQTLFREFDRNGDGMIDITEFTSALRQAGMT